MWNSWGPISDPWGAPQVTALNSNTVLLVCLRKTGIYFSSCWDATGAPEKQKKYLEKKKASSFIFIQHDDFWPHWSMVQRQEDSDHSLRVLPGVLPVCPTFSPPLCLCLCLYDYRVMIQDLLWSQQSDTESEGGGGVGGVCAMEEKTQKRIMGVLTGPHCLEPWGCLAPLPALYFTCCSHSLFVLLYQYLSHTPELLAVPFLDSPLSFTLTYILVSLARPPLFADIWFCEWFYEEDDMKCFAVWLDETAWDIQLLFSCDFWEQMVCVCMSESVCVSVCGREGEKKTEHTCWPVRAFFWGISTLCWVLVCTHAVMSWAALFNRQLGGHSSFN